jgi:L-ribulose-5-phosphate 4-epimerase
MDIFELKQAVYRANMELRDRGLVIYTWGNVSQADRSAGIMAIKPSGVPYDELTPEMMVIISLETGEKLEKGALRPSSDAPTHLALYRAFNGINGVAHTHSAYAVAWAQAGMDIPALGTTHADYFRGAVPVTRFLTGDEVARGYEYETGAVIAERFSGLNPIHTPAALARGHGPFTWGKDALEAAFHAAVLEEIARIAHLTLSVNPRAEPLVNAMADKHFYRKHGPDAYYGQDSAI